MKPSASLLLLFLAGLAACATTAAARLESALPAAADAGTPPPATAPEDAPPPTGDDPARPGAVTAEAGDTSPGRSTAGGEGASAAAPASPRAGRDRAAAVFVAARLRSLARCERGTKVGQLTFSLGACTRMACPEACCNACSWTASFVSTNGVARPADPAQVKAVLLVSEQALECEVGAWNAALRGQDVGLEGGGCAVR